MDPIGAHVCGFFNDQERRAEILDAFVAEAVDAGDKCYCLLEHAYPAAATHPGSEQLTASETYLAGGRFSAEAMLGRLQRLASQAVLVEGYPGVRAVGEMGWAAAGFPGAGELWRYESAVNRLASRHRQVLLCLYDLTRFLEEAVDQVLRTHPWMLVADVVLPNPYFRRALEPTC